MPKIARPLIACVLIAAALPGCQKRDTAATAARASSAASGNGQEIWEALFLEGAKIGYMRTTTRPVERSGKELIAIDIFNQLTLVRFGEQVRQELSMSTLETADGRVVQFSTQADLGPTPVRMEGRVEGDQMVIHTNGSPQAVRIPWADDIRGFRGLEQSLEQKPMTTGERRTLRLFAPLMNQVADVEMTAGQSEDTPVLETTVNLLRIETSSRLPDGNVMNETLWTDDAGRVVKRSVAAMRQESFRTSRETALAPADKRKPFDLGTDTIVKLDAPLVDPHHARQIRYRVELSEADPLKVFAAEQTQSIRSIGTRAAELTVRQFDPSARQKSESVDLPKEYLAANSMLQVDDPRISAMARQAKGNATSPRDIVIALEKYVNQVVDTKDFSQTFASAADVAESREGDCTEHAVLLAALARACGIPSRVAIGLVYVPRAQGFGYHMWTEAFIDEQWMPLDATLGQGGIGAGHIKLTDSSLDGSSAYSTFLPVAQVVGQLKISVLERD